MPARKAYSKYAWVLHSASGQIMVVPLSPTCSAFSPLKPPGRPSLQLWHRPTASTTRNPSKNRPNQGLTAIGPARAACHTSSLRGSARIRNKKKVSDCSYVRMYLSGFGRIDPKLHTCKIRLVAQDDVLKMSPDTWHGGREMNLRRVLLGRLFGLRS